MALTAKQERFKEIASNVILVFHIYWISYFMALVLD
jgi:hypothetical protein